MSEQETEQRKVIDFMGHRKLAQVFSIVLLLGSLISLGFNGLNYGLDFTGGTLVEVSYSEVESLNEIRNSLEQAGYNNAVVVHFGSDTDIMIRLAQGYNDKLGNTRQR